MRLSESLAKFNFDCFFDNIFKNGNLTQKYEEISDCMIVFPSMQIFTYFFTRLQSAYKIIEQMIRIINQHIFSHVITFIKSSSFLPNHVLFLSVVSRLYIILKCYKKEILNLYSSLKENVTYLRSIKLNWATQFKYPVIDYLDRESTVEKVLHLELSLGENNPSNETNPNDDFGEIVSRKTNEISNSGQLNKMKGKSYSPYYSKKWKKHKKRLLKKLVSFMESLENKEKTKVNMAKFNSKCKSFFKINVSKHGNEYIDYLNYVVENYKKYEKIIPVKAFKNPTDHLTKFERNILKKLLLLIKLHVE